MSAGRLPGTAGDERAGPLEVNPDQRADDAVDGPDSPSDGTTGEPGDATSGDLGGRSGGGAGEPDGAREPSDGTTGEPGDSTGDDGTGDEVRDRLIRAAAEVFAREGYAGTKILDIVRQAGVSTGAVYGRFRSKNELLREAVVRRSRRGGAMASGARSLADLIRFGARLTPRPLYSFEAMRLEAYVTARRDPEVADALADAAARWREGVEPLVAAAMADGTLGDVDPEAVLFLFRTLYLGGLLHRGSGLPGPDPAAWEALVDRLVAALGQPAVPDPDDPAVRGDDTRAREVT